MDHDGHGKHELDIILLNDDANCSIILLPVSDFFETSNRQPPGGLSITPFKKTKNINNNNRKPDVVIRGAR